MVSVIGKKFFVMKIIAIDFPFDINILLQILLLLGSVLRIELLLQKLLLLQLAGGVCRVLCLAARPSPNVECSAELNNYFDI